MDNREQLRRITELTEQIAGLPKGYLSKKTIGGKVYYYHQWSENGVKQSRYLTTVRSRRWQIKSKSARNCRRSCAC